MHCFFLATVLSLSLGYSLSSDASSSKYGSHNLLKLERNNSLHRSARCTPCDQDTDLKKPMSNHLDPEFRGNGADNLGYDWSPMAWGGLAFPRNSKFNMGGMSGRDGRMMMTDGGRNQGNIHIICDTCRAYWSGDGRDGSTRRGGGRGRQFDPPGSSYFSGQPGTWEGNRMRLPADYETRVMSPTVGVLVKPGSRIAYIPSRSGEMYWDGISGGGTRWDGFSNGISWIGNGNSQEWDRSDSEAPGGAETSRLGGDYSYGSNAYGSWNNQKRPNWSDNSGRGYYFTNGVPNNIDPQWRDKGYASNWHYGSTNQNGWNGNSMKWNYGGKQWPDNDRAANRFYFNTPQDRTYRPNDGQQHQYGNQYPNYQSGTGYPSNIRPYPPWPTSGGYRPNDRFPASFQQGSYEGGDKNRPWDYTSRDPLAYRRPGSEPEWTRPITHPAPGNNLNSYGKFPGSYGGHDKFTPSDRNDYEKPWNKPSGHGFSKPGAVGGFPYGGNSYPEENGVGGRPNYPSNGGLLFIPNDGNSQSGYPNMGSGENRPSYSSGNRKPSEYPSSGSQVSTYPADGRPTGEYAGNKQPSLIYTGGRPLGVGGSLGGYPSGGRPSGGYPSGESSSGGYPSGGRPSAVYPSGGSSSGGYPSGGRPSGEYPSGGRPSEGYPSGGSSSGGYPSGGRPSAGYPSGESSSGGYPSGGRPSGEYPSGGRPSEGYPSGGSSSGGYPSGGRPSGGYPSGGSSSGGYPSGGSSSGGYPSGGRPSGGYPSGGRPSEGYPSGGSSSGGYLSGGRPSGGYPSGESSSGGYPSGGGFPLYTNGNRPSNYPGSGSGGSSYPSGVGRPGGYFVGGSYSEDGSRPGSRPDKYYGGGGGSHNGYPSESGISYPMPSGYPNGEGSSRPSGGSRPGFYPDDGYLSSGYFEGSQPTSINGARRPAQSYPGESNRPDGYYSGNRPNYSIRVPPSYPGTGSGGSKNPPKGYYTGFITEIKGDDRLSQYGGRYPNYFGGIYPGDKNFYPEKNRDKYYNEGSYSNQYPSGEKNRFPEYSEDRYSAGGSRGDGYPAANTDRGSDKFYYGQSDGNGKYSGAFSSNNKYPNGGDDNFDRNQGSSSVKHWNYGQTERKDGIYRRSGGSYPPYRGGEYYTSSYLASMSTTAGSTPVGTEPKTQSVTKADEVTQATSDSS